MTKYDHKQVEQKWVAFWEEKGWFKATPEIDRQNKKYILAQWPYPSGEGLHAGHSEVYTANDIYARYYRMRGYDVLQPIGWDAFGLPAENFAIKTNLHPRVNTDRAINNFRNQIKGLGISLDWTREVGSHNPDYYKWTQWFFLLMHKRGLAYRKKQLVNWCEKDKTVLANEQVVDGKCERCGTQMIQKEMEQWFLKITEYADRLLQDLDKVDYPDEAKRRQREWIGRSEGAEIDFNVIDADGNGHTVTVFSTAHDTIYGATFLSISPEHKIVQEGSISANNQKELSEYIEQASHKSELERQQQPEKTGVKMEGVYAVHPLTSAQIPVYVADYVLSGYGTGAVMGVPAHDERDGDFAKKYNLPIVSTTVGGDSEFISYSDNIKKDLAKYILENSAEFSGQTYEQARPAILAKLVKIGVGREKVNYRLRDWSISRQRFWGAPVPMVYDPEGNVHPVREDDLPVILPDDVDFLPTGQSPLTYSPSFQQGVEEKYGKGWKREVDTLDTFMCSSWYFFRYLDPKNENEFAGKDTMSWMPVDFYIGGPEHVNGHLLYSRFFTKVLFDAGYIDFDEPFMMHRHQGTILGPDNRKMSKRWGNIVNPTDIVEKYGADTMRCYLMFMGPLEQDKAWNDSAVQGIRRFLGRVYDMQQAILSTGFAEDTGELAATLHKLIRKVTIDTEGLRFNTALAEFMKVLKLFEAQPQLVTKSDWEAYLKLMAPYAPFLTDELWAQLGNTQSIHYAKWPEYKLDLAVEDIAKVTIQINGKVRSVIELPLGTSQEDTLAAVGADEKVAKYLTAEPRKVIFVQDKIVNFVI